MNQEQLHDTLKACKPKTAEQFGYFLAGLIDADGHIEKEGNVCVAFHQSDLGAACYIQKIIGYGTVSKVKNTKSYRYRCCHTDKVRRIGDFIRNKLRHPDKIKQYNERLVPKIGGLKTKATPDDTFDNHWLAGFIQGDGGFQIQITNRSHPSRRIQIMTLVRISQKKAPLLKQIAHTFGGYIHYCKAQDYFIYSSSSIPNAGRFVNYLDKYQLISSRFRVYLLWRQAHLNMKKLLHRDVQGQQHIIKLKTRMSKLKV